MRTVTHEALVERAGLAVAIAATRAPRPRLRHARRGALRARVERRRRPRGRAPPGRGAAPTCACSRSTAPPPSIDGVDLVVDAAFGTGLSRRWDAPGHRRPACRSSPSTCPRASTRTRAPRSATRSAPTRTVAMGALKRGHLLADGARLSGRVDVAPIGIDVVDDVVRAGRGRRPRRHRAPRARRAQVASRAVVVVAGSPGMLGAPGARLRRRARGPGGHGAALRPGRARAAARARGRARSSGSPRAPRTPRRSSSTRSSAPASLVVGPGLGRSARLERMVHDVLRVDARARRARRRRAAPRRRRPPARRASSAAAARSSSRRTTASTPRCSARPRAPTASRAAERAAARTGCTVLLKGPTTVVASATPPPGSPAVLVVTSGTPDLATPGLGRRALRGDRRAARPRGPAAPRRGRSARTLHGRAGAALGAACRAAALPGAVTAVLVERVGGRGA